MGATTQRELMDGLAEAVVVVLTERQGVPFNTACRVGQAFAARMAFVWADNIIHIPKGAQYKVLQRNQALFNDFTGSNHAPLGRKYGISIQMVYDIVKRMRQEYIERHQMDMFDNKATPDNKEVSDFLSAGLLVLDDIMTHCAVCIREHLTIDETQARTLGEEVANYMSNHWHGQTAYIRSGKTEAADDDQDDLFGNGGFKTL
ncbi:hypothetical protein NAE50_002196 [Salmonella enterica]|nr:hypothetical protein [Salmonella enterica]ELX2841859.1 hypothetical protein [Salmonella enterica]